MEKQCSKCKELKSIGEFNKCKKEKSGLRSRCKKCTKSDGQEYRYKNKEKIKKSAVEYSIKNKEKKKAYKKKWREENREKFNASARAWNKKNKHIISWRAILRRTLKSKGIKKTTRTEELLGYDAEKFRIYIESLWEDGMTWDNYGEWHIDHIIPVIQFPNNTPPSIVNALKNLKPLWAKDNLPRPNDAPPVEKRPYTLLVDIDGSLVSHDGKLSEQMGDLKLLPGVREKFEEWDKKGYKIILTTGRKESMRALTECQLQNLGLFWDQLIMGLGGGTRILINDMKPDSYTPTAIAINLERNKGLESINIENDTRLQTLAMFYGVDI